MGADCIPDPGDTLIIYAVDDDLDQFINETRILLIDETSDKKDEGFWLMMNRPFVSFDFHLYYFKEGLLLHVAAFHRGNCKFGVDPQGPFRVLRFGFYPVIFSLL